MREIKFRAWHHEGVAENQPMTMTYWKLGTGMDNSQFYKHAKAVMQYTGLKDKNSVEIYEGDIVKEWPDSDAYWVRIVEYTSHGFALSTMANFLQHKVDWTKQVEVIGNIYENPHLLEQAS